MFSMCDLQRWAWQSCHVSFDAQVFTGILINLILLFDLLLDHSFYKHMDNGVSTDDICQHKEIICLYSY